MDRWHGVPFLIALNLRTASAVHDRPAIGMQHLSRHVAGVVTGQEQEGRRNLIGLAGPTHRRAFAKMLQLFRTGAAAGIERRPDRAGRDSIDANALANQIFR